MAHDGTTVIVGGSHAGVQCALTLRRLSSDRKIILLEADRNLPYERPPLSKAVLAGGSGSDIRKPAVYERQRIDLRLGTRVGAVDPINGKVELSDGGAIPFDTLVLATGTRARYPQVAGLKLDGVRALRTLDDARWLASQMKPGSRLVIVGGGFIGLEAAAAAANANVHVTVIEAAARVLARVTTEAVSRYFEALHTRNGVKLCLGQSIAVINGRDGRVESVVTTDGRRLEADIVLIGIGVIPAQDLAVAAGIACDNGIEVDRFCRTSHDNIFAAGDVTNHENIAVGRRLRLECVQNAVSQGEVAAHTISGIAREYSEVPWFWTEQFNVRMQSAGIPQPSDTKIIRGDPDAASFSVIYVRDQRVTAVDTINSLPDFVAAKQLIRDRTPVDDTALADYTRPLSQLARRAPWTVNND
jgi:3-phenylpropionate/trans-cinnamate dioxygenase ferredoxin reductase component